MADNAVIDAPEHALGMPEDGIRRRDFINIAAVSAAGVGAVAVLLPLISQMAPSSDVLAESSTDVDLAAIAPGQGIKAVFRSQPLFVRRLTPKEIAMADAVPMSASHWSTRTGRSCSPYLAAPWAIRELSCGQTAPL